MAEQAPSVEERLSNWLAQENEPETVAETEPEPVQAEPAEEVTEVEEKPVEAKEETEEETASEEVEEIEVSSLNDLAEHIGVEVADLYALEIPVTDEDGKKVNISLGEWKDGFQSSKIYAKRQQELQAERERFTQQQQQYEAELNLQRQAASKFLETAEQALRGDIDRIDWQSLREADPAEFSAKRQEMLERQAMLEGAKKDLAAQVETSQREQAEKQQAQLEALKERERAALYEAFPAWKDPKVAETEWAQAAQALTEVGFTEAEIGQVIDHRAYKLAMLAAKGLQASQKADVAKKRVLKLGNKVLKPGAKKSKADAADEGYRAARAKLRKSGKPEDAVALIRERFT